MKNSPKNFYNVVDKKKLGIDEAVAVAGDVAELKSDVSQLETVVEDPDTGLVKTVADLKEVVDNIDYDISRKADIDGTYPDMTVGNADQLNSTQMITDKVPYVFRTSGGSNDIGNRENDKLVGGSVVFNEVIKNNNFDGTTNWGNNRLTLSAGNNILTGVVNDVSYNFVSAIQKVDPVNGHKYFIMADIMPKITVASASISIGGTTITKNTPTVNEWNRIMGLVSSGTGSYFAMAITYAADTIALDDEIDFKNPLCIDLTQLFGSAVADQLYSLEQAQSGSGVALFRAMFPKDYYAYNAGQLMSVKAIAHEMVGFNQWDEEWELGAISASTGQNTTSDNRIRSKNYIRVFPQTQYYFKSSNSFRVFYYTATKEFISAPNTTAGNYLFTTPAGAYYMRFILVTDTFIQNDVCINLSWTGYRNGEYEPYVKYSYVLDQDLELRGIAKVDGNGNIYYDGDTYSSDGTVIRNYEIRAYASGDESLPDAITDGTNTVVKLDTPVEESADPFQDPQWVDDFGTEEYVDTRDIPVPVGHITQYPANLRDKLQHLPCPTGVNGDYIIREDTEVMTLVPAPTGVPELPSVDGTYVLTCTVSDGTATLSWTSNA